MASNLLPMDLLDHRTVDYLCSLIPLLSWNDSDFAVGTRDNIGENGYPHRRGGWCTDTSLIIFPQLIRAEHPHPHPIRTLTPNLYLLHIINLYIIWVYRCVNQVGA